MPLTSKGRKILANMKSQYGEKKGESVFYASKNKGTISGVDGLAERFDKWAEGPKPMWRPSAQDAYAPGQSQTSELQRQAIGAGWVKPSGAIKPLQPKPTGGYTFTKGGDATAGRMRPLKKILQSRLGTAGAAAGPVWKAGHGPPERIRGAKTHDDQFPPWQCLLDNIMKKFGGTPPSPKHVQDTFDRVLSRTRDNHPTTAISVPPHMQYDRQRVRDTFDRFLTRHRTRDQSSMPMARSVPIARSTSMTATPPDLPQPSKVTPTGDVGYGANWRPPPADQTPVRIGKDALFPTWSDPMPKPSEGKLVPTPKTTTVRQATPRPRQPSAAPAKPANPAAEQLSKAASQHGAAARAHTEAAKVHTQAASNFSGAHGNIVAASRPQPKQYLENPNAPKPPQRTGIVHAMSPQQIDRLRKRARAIAAPKPGRLGDSATADECQAKAAPPMQPQGTKSNIGVVVSGDAARFKAAFRDARRSGKLKAMLRVVK